MKTPEIISNAPTPHFALIELSSRSNAIAFCLNDTMFRRLELTKLCTDKECTLLSLVKKLKEVELVNYSERNFNMPEFNISFQTMINKILSDDQNDDVVGFTKTFLIGHGFNLSAKYLPLIRKHNDYYKPEIAKVVKGTEFNFSVPLTVKIKQTVSRELMKSDFSETPGLFFNIWPVEESLVSLFNNIIRRTDVLIQDGLVLGQDEKCKVLLNTFNEVIRPINERIVEMLSKGEVFVVHTEYFDFEFKFPKHK